MRVFMAVFMLMLAGLTGPASAQHDKPSCYELYVAKVGNHGVQYRVRNCSNGATFWDRHFNGGVGAESAGPDRSR